MLSNIGFNRNIRENSMKIKTAIAAAAFLAAVVPAHNVYAQSKNFKKEIIQQESVQLSPEKAKIYNDAMQAADDGNQDLRMQIHKAHDEADAILTAEKFDKKAFLAKAAELDGLYAKMRERNNEAYVSVMEKLTQDDRKILLKAHNDRRHHA